MKKLRSILALLMVAVMMLSFGVIAMADEVEEPAADGAGVQTDVAVTEWEEIRTGYDKDGYPIWTKLSDVATSTNEKGEVVVECKYGDASGQVLARKLNVVANKYDIGTMGTADHVKDAATIVTDATCTEGGTATWTCKICGKTFTETVKPQGHLWSSAKDAIDWGRIITEPTCTTAGEAEDFCLRCGEKNPKMPNRVIPALGHMWKNVVVTKPQCVKSEDDNEEFFTTGTYKKVCERCGITEQVNGNDVLYKFSMNGFDENGKPAKNPDGSPMPTAAELRIREDGHDWAGWVTLKAATCTTAGERVRSCRRCGKDVNEVIPPINHEGHMVKVEDMLLDCYTRYELWKCELCEAQFTGLSMVQEHGPDKGKVTFIPNAKETLTNGAHEYYSIKDKDLGKDDRLIVFAYGVNDKYEENLKALTCGDYAEVIVMCKHSYENNTQKHIDEFQASMKAATGIEGVTDAMVKTAFEHYHADIVSRAKRQPATAATENEKKIVEAVEAGKVACIKVILKGNPIEHDWNEWVCEYTQTDDGEKFGHWVRTCKRCGRSEDFNGTYSPVKCAAGKHNYELKSTDAASCTEAGQAFYVCSICGDSYGTEIAATGHDYEAVVTAATCTAGGYTTYTCKICGDSYVADETEPAAHEYEAVVATPTCENGGYTTYTCKNCGDSYVADETEALGHKWNEGEVVFAATCVKEGKLLKTCSVCNALITEVIPALGHDLIDDAAVEPQIGVAGKEAGKHCSRCDYTEGGKEIPALIANEYAMDVSGITVDENGISGEAKVEKTKGTAPEDALYARIVISFKRDDGTTYSISVVNPVIDGEFEAPTVSGSFDPITSVTVILCNTKNVGANWSGSNVLPPVPVA